MMSLIDYVIESIRTPLISMAAGFLLADIIMKVNKLRNSKLIKQPQFVKIELTEKEFQQMLSIVNNENSSTLQIEHCFHQMIRFANLAKKGDTFRAAQFGLNLGRVQEMLGSHGGIPYWWGTYEPMITYCCWDQIINNVKNRIDMLGLHMPTESFINKK